MSVLGRTDQIIKDAVTASTGGTGGYDPAGSATGLLAPEQSGAFIDMVMDGSGFLKEVDYELKTKVEGTVSLLGVTRRNFRKKIEDTNTISGSEAKPVIGDVPYKTTGIAMGTEISNDWFRQNIEREGFEDHFMREVSKQISLDTLDLALNGDESSSDPFESINDGWIKILKSKVPAAQQIDGTAINGGEFNDQYFYEMRKALPAKYFNQGKYKWICSNLTQVKVMEYLRNRQTAAGDAALVNGVQLNPLAIPFTCPADFPDDLIIFGDPKLLKIIWTYNVGMRKTTEGKELVSKDNRFYAWFFDMDFITLLPEAFTLLTNVGEVLDPSPIVVSSKKATAAGSTT